MIIQVMIKQFLKTLKQWSHNKLFNSLKITVWYTFQNVCSSRVHSAISTVIRTLYTTDWWKDYYLHINLIFKTVHRNTGILIIPPPNYTSQWQVKTCECLILLNQLILLRLQDMLLNLLSHSSSWDLQTPSLCPGCISWDSQGRWKECLFPRWCPSSCWHQYRRILQPGQSSCQKVPTSLVQSYVYHLLQQCGTEHIFGQRVSCLYQRFLLGYRPFFTSREETPVLFNSKLPTCALRTLGRDET